MREYLNTVIIATICISFFNQLIPSGRGIEKYTRFIGMLLLASVVFAPAVSMIKEFDVGFFDDLRDDIADLDSEINDEYQDLFGGYLTDYSIEQFKKSIEEILLSRFNIPAEDCDITVNTDIISGQLKVEKLQILLSGKSIFKNPYDIENYFTELIGCNCTVLIRRG